MADQFQNPDLVQQENPKMEELRRELARRSQDRVKVRNPLEYDREVVWNRFVNVIPASGDVVLPRYIGEKYVKEMVDHMITVKNEERVVTGVQDSEMVFPFVLLCKCEHDRLSMLSYFPGLRYLLAGTVCVTFARLQTSASVVVACKGASGECA